MSKLNMHEPERIGTRKIVWFHLAKSGASMSFWLFFMMWLFQAYCIFMVLAHIVRHCLDMGISYREAAFVLSLIGGAGAAGRLLMGVISDKIGQVKCCMISTVFMAGAMLWLIIITGPRELQVFAIIWGFFYGGLGPSTSSWIVETFGLNHLGMILGMLSIGWTVGAALGPAVAGHLFDIHRSYDAAFASASFALLLTGVLIVLQPKPVSLR